MSLTQDDELMLLWRQGTSAEPDPREIARLAGRASMRRFDRSIFWRNLLEYAAGLTMLVLFGWEIATGYARAHAMIGELYVGSMCVAFVLAYLWWQHRDLTPLDPSADARAYQTAMLTRIDKQIRLLGSVRYWGLMPFFVAALWTFLGTVRERPLASAVELAWPTAALVGVAWLNERWGVPWLRAERSKIERLYEG